MSEAQSRQHRRFLVHWTAAGYGERYDKGPWRLLDQQAVRAILDGNDRLLDAVIVVADQLRIYQGGKEPERIE